MNGGGQLLKVLSSRRTRIDRCHACRSPTSHGNVALIALNGPTSLLNDGDFFSDDPWCVCCAWQHNNAEI
jgi:hypothetical protein